MLPEKGAEGPLIQPLPDGDFPVTFCQLLSEHLLSNPLHPFPLRSLCLKWGQRKKEVKGTWNTGWGGRGKCCVDPRRGLNREGRWLCNTRGAMGALKSEGHKRARGQRWQRARLGEEVRKRTFWRIPGS